ncbi:ribosomal protein S18 acetylase RimI-like enzyme [Chitinophaga terrae (ex Kim and Jung 2007)]|uniref:GNAT family N-acetyltransferase n=1 Tax=Chitinophaga terrae (ex Kim and Jung 2007) TaxID=408074 RepID=UPI0027873D1A|nr:GNAT family N-acetyltransferase [Chitinophaga terrae (ex Kim and Jung 2007)]MDQ0106260.1 ribosomal protein S18 acetylase RimI-like enzyme [Chitinophaga terrae (ex Kim and Jung 2007)]
MDSILIVPAITAEAELLQKLARQTFEEAFASSNTAANMQLYAQQNFTIPRLTAELSNPESEFFWAMHKIDPVGYLKLNFGSAQTELFNSKAVGLERIYVTKAWQGKGIGQQLLDQAIDSAIAVNAPFLWLGVWEHNKNAIAFYEKNRFEVFDKHPFKLGNEVQTDLLMRLDLPAKK